MSETLHQVMLTAAAEPAALRALRDDPTALADRFGLSGDVRDRLADAEQLVPRDARGEYVTITLHTITITAGHGL
ncbi:hypothetical protein [Streptomyces cinnamoneus]|uniref:Uncharacterized protein n=1 Tax=Streptomyces cinnamoneus TaxID=53446 RepID=A0A918WGS3_STRCJ|nr:hypothetical protein [Streptomyces cinnamoneus]GHC45167.1 hypothetical protein GCM10010507_20460 [Streptomyces cinnamoneus]